MTNGEIQAIRNVIARLREEDCGCSHALIGPDGPELAEAIKTAHEHGCEVVGRGYLESWIIGALECLLPEARDVDLAVKLSDRADLRAKAKAQA